MTALSPQQQLERKDSHADDAAAADSGRRSRYSSGAASFREDEAALSPNAPDTLMTLFERMDANKDGGISRDEVKGHLTAIKVKAGFMGMVHSKVADKMMDGLDKNDDGLVTWAEFQSIASELLPDSLFDDNGAMRMELIQEHFAGFDRDQDGSVSLDELKDGIKELLPEGTSHASVIADVAAKFMDNTLESDEEKGLTEQEVLLGTQSVAALRRNAQMGGDDT